LAILNEGRNRDGGAVQPVRWDWSLVLDFKIPVKIPWAVMSGAGADQEAISLEGKNMRKSNI